MPMRLNASRFVLRASACHQFTDSGAPRHGPSLFDMQPDDLSAAGSCATALARRHRTDGLGRVALFDVAILTLGHKEHLGDVVAGYGTDVDRDLIRAWWSLRCLTNVRWLAEHGYGSPEEFPEVAVLRSRP